MARPSERSERHDCLVRAHEFSRKVEAQRALSIATRLNQSKRPRAWLHLRLAKSHRRTIETVPSVERRLAAQIYCGVVEKRLQGWPRAPEATLLLPSSPERDKSTHLPIVAVICRSQPLEARMLQLLNTIVVDFSWALTAR